MISLNSFPSFWRSLFFVIFMSTLLAVLLQIVGGQLSFKGGVIVGGEPSSNLALFWGLDIYDGYEVWWASLGATIMTFNILPMCFCFFLLILKRKAMHEKYAYRANGIDDASKSNNVLCLKRYGVLAMATAVLMFVGLVIRYMIFMG